MKNILVLCTGNSCRSQMADAYLKYYQKNNTNIYSAGVETHGINPGAKAILLEDGLDISTYTSNNIKEYMAIHFDLILTVCDHANEVCPNFPQNTKKIHYNFSDPSKFSGGEEEKKVAFRKTREEIKGYIQKLVSDYNL